MIVNPNALPAALEAAQSINPSVDPQLIEAAVSAALKAIQDDVKADLDTRMKAAGMMTIDQVLSTNNPINRFMAHSGVTDIKSFEQWLEMRHREFAHMRVKYELDRETKDELYEWVLAHSGALGEVIVNFRKATGNQA